MYISPSIVLRVSFFKPWERALFSITCPLFFLYRSHTFSLDCKYYDCKVVKDLYLWSLTQNFIEEMLSTLIFFLQASGSSFHALNAFPEKLNVVESSTPQQWDKVDKKQDKWTSGPGHLLQITQCPDLLVPFGMRKLPWCSLVIQKKRHLRLH